MDDYAEIGSYITIKKLENYKAICSYTREEIKRGMICAIFENPANRSKIYIKLNKLFKLKKEIEELNYNEFKENDNKKNLNNFGNIKFSVYDDRFIEGVFDNFEKTCCYCGDIHEIDIPSKTILLSMRYIEGETKVKRVEISEECFDDFCKDIEKLPEDIKSYNTLNNI